MKKERLFQVIGMIEDNWIKEAEEETIIQKKRIPMPAFLKWGTVSWKWTAAVAGILLMVGMGGFYRYRNQTSNSTTSQNGAFMETAADQMLRNEDIGELEMEMMENGEAGFEGEDTVLADGNYKSEEGIRKPWQSLSDQKRDTVFLYAAIIAEIYQPYQNGSGVLYLNVEDGFNLEEEQKNVLLEVLNGTYGIDAVTGRFEELCEQGVIDAEAEEISGIYLSFEVTGEEENGVRFQIDCWGGRNVIFGRENCYAFYTEDGWVYELGE